MDFPALKNKCYLNIIYLKMKQTGLKLNNSNHLGGGERIKMDFPVNKSQCH